MTPEEESAYRIVRSFGPPASVVEDATRAKEWLVAADEILDREASLSDREAEFVRDMRARAEHDADLRVSKRYEFTERQMKWFVAIYRRVTGYRGKP